MLPASAATSASRLGNLGIVLPSFSGLWCVGDQSARPFRILGGGCFPPFWHDLEASNRAFGSVESAF